MWDAARRRTSASRSLAVGAWLVLGLLPYVAIYVAHVWHGSGHPTGFILYDTPYYVASGREIFERGNGWAYPNPYDISTDPPAIYFHWLIWIFGFGVSRLHLSPGWWFVAVGAAGAAAMAFFTWKLIGRFVRPVALRPFAFLLAMWGGGVFVPWTAVENLLRGAPVDQGLFRLDPFGGWWFLSWGRNAVLPPEAVYHALVAAAWLAIVAGRPLVGAGLVVALAATHPFSGALHLSILLVWFGMRAVVARDRSLRAPLLVTMAAATAFGWYNLRFLPSFANHVEIQPQLELDWPMPASAWLLSCALVAPLVVARLARVARAFRRGRPSLRPHDSFFLVAAAVSLVFVHHDLVFQPRQQLHFTRGYVWMASFMFGLPFLVAVVRTARRGARGAMRRLAMAAILAIASIDNLTWCAHIARSQPQSFYLSPEEVDLLTRLDGAGVQGVAVAPYPLGYLLGTYTHLTPYLGHMLLTTRLADRNAQVEAFFAGAASDLPVEVEWLIVPASAYGRSGARLRAFAPAFTDDHFVVLRRTAGRS